MRSTIAGDQSAAMVPPSQGRAPDTMAPRTSQLGAEPLFGCFLITSSEPDFSSYNLLSNFYAGLLMRYIVRR